MTLQPRTLPEPDPTMPRFEAQTRTLDNGWSVTVSAATDADMDDLKQLYYEAYGGKYTLGEVNDRDKMKWCLHDPNYLWLINRVDGKLVCAALFVVDPRHRVGKTFAGVVHPKYRGHKMTVATVKMGRDFLIEDRKSCDVMYAIVRTFVSPTFHLDLNDIGFVDMGVFPNVRKIKKYETHGFKVYFGPNAIAQRRKRPTLIPPAARLYDIVRHRLGLEEADVGDPELEPRPPAERYEFLIERNSQIEWEYYKERDAGNLLFAFYPFMYPHFKLYTRDQTKAAFIEFQEKDGHGVMLGLRTPGDFIVRDLVSVAEYAESLGVKYLEMLVPAHDRLMQKLAYEAGFLPCAYFPAARMDEHGERLDYIVTANIFVPPHFKGLRLTPETRPYLQAFYRIYTDKLWEDLQ